MTALSNKDMNATELMERLEQAQARIRQLESLVFRQSHAPDPIDPLHNGVIDHLPTALLEFDLSGLKAFVDRLRSNGVSNIEAHLVQHPQALREAFSHGRVTFLNRVARKIFQVGDTVEFINFFAQFFTQEAASKVCRFVGELDGGKTNGNFEAEFRTRSNDPIFLGLFWALPREDFESWRRVMVTLMDLTPRKIAEQALAQSEDRYRGLFENNPSAMCLIDTSGRKIIDANQAASDLFGYSRDALASMPMDNLNAPGQDDTSNKLAEAANGPARLELRQRFADGTVHEVELYAGPFMDQTGKKILATIHDITQRKRAMENLRRAEGKYRNIIEQSVQGIIQSTVEGKVISVNPSMARITGYDSTEEAMKSVSNIGSQVYSDPLRREQLIKELNQHGTVQSFPIQIKRRDGDMAWISYTARAVKDENDKIISIEGFVEDITSRITAEEALAQSEKRYRAIVDNSLAAIYIFQDDKMVFLNKAFLDMLGYSDQAQGLGRPFWEFIHPLDREWVKMRAQARARGENVKPHYAFRCLKADNTVIWVDMQATTIFFHGKPAVLGNLIDITERKMLTDRLAQSQKMEAVGTLASGIAHDFNNILQAISGYVQMVMSDGVSQPNLRRMKEIDSAVLRAADLIQRMLAFSRDLAPQFIGVDINKEISQAVKLIERTIPKWISIKTELENDLPLVNGDPISLVQMLMNMAANARDAMPDGGTLTISSRMIDIDESFCSTRPDLEPGPYVLIRVADSGPGIDESIIKQIFDPFFSTKEIGRGTGLGLSQVYGTVKSHQGHIDCESTLGLGTEFKIYLPSKQPDQQTTNNDHEPEKQVEGGGEVILLVDDETAILEISSQVLSDHGYAVHTADCGENALKELDRLGRADLVVLDLGMPGMGGRRCFEQIKLEHQSTKVIIASGYADEDNRAWAMERGADAFLAKPYRLPDLLSEVRRVLEN